MIEFIFFSLNFFFWEQDIQNRATDAAAVWSCCNAFLIYFMSETASLLECLAFSEEREEKLSEGNLCAVFSNFMMQ